MGRYVGKRILLMVPVLMGVTLLIFLLLHFTPGDPARMQLGTLATEEEILAQREKMGLNDPLVVQFGRYLKNLVTDLDLGVSYTSGRPVTTEIFSRYPLQKHPISSSQEPIWYPVIPVSDCPCRFRLLQYLQQHFCHRRRLLRCPSRWNPRM